MEYKRMRDEQNILSSPDNHHHHPHPNHHDHHRQHKRRFCFIAAVMTFTIVISYIIVVGASFGIHQKNALIHGNYMVNSSIIINIIVNGHNKSLSSDDDDNAMIFRIIEEVFDDDDEEYVGEDDSNEKTSEAPSSAYEEIDKSIPIERGPLRIPNPDLIPIINEAKWKTEE